MLSSQCKITNKNIQHTTPPPEASDPIEIGPGKGNLTEAQDEITIVYLRFKDLKDVKNLIGTSK